MNEQPAATRENQPVRYRVVIDGRLDSVWAGWFECDVFPAEGDRTAIEVDVVDQAQLHAVLRRVHDLHLHLVSVARVERSNPITSTGETP
jgi:hypothetical protein